MVFVLSIIGALALFTPTLAAVTPAEVEAGKVEGFTAGKIASHLGDYLLSTFCFCNVPTPVPQQYSEANYLQFEYYNFHQNTTFILDHLCLADQDSNTTCFAPRTGDGLARSSGVDWEGPICRTWYKAGNMETQEWSDELCYKPAESFWGRWREFRLPGPDVLKFDGQKRRLDLVGGQGPRLRSKEEAEDSCAVLCDEHAGMEVLRGNDRAQSHVVAHEDMDDMCPHCQ